MEPARDQCAFYFTKDDMENLQIKVTLQQLTGSQLVAVSPRIVEDTQTGKQSDVPLALLPTSSATTRGTNATPHTQHITVKWQQKLISVCEAVEYRRSVYANDPKCKARHKQALKRKKQQRIFTYVHEDNYQIQEQRATTTSKRLEPECCLRRRANRARGNDSIDSTEPSEKSNEMAQEKSKRRQASTFKQQYFYIMADLAPQESLGESRVYETILCVLKYDGQSQLTVTPDFNTPTTKAYRLESFGSDNALYEYQIENVSLTCPAEERNQEEQLANQLARQRIEEIQLMAGLEWGTEQEPERGELRLVTVGEITRAMHFPEASSLYVHYALYLPPGWRANPGTECEGFTPTCWVSHSDKEPAAHFSSPFSLDVTRSPSGQGWPMLLLAAFSLDWFGCDRDEGYAAFTLPTPVVRDKCQENDGVYQVGTWRPAQVSSLAKMRRFFLGGCQLMSDPSYLAVGTPAATQVGRVSRLGFSTCTSGTIEVRATTVAQADFIEKGECSILCDIFFFT
ncbi:tectonic-like complex member MKS1 [Eriocheir sinensis]|uniref:tectonic-like complex member MKS1 n=1 Tax=Eriocheir sinensis TaxID=95602 RepID=UPI0021CA4A30|nr:tectonic-like complex member MKS1 [Eriocheir sinensis]XP_050728570.1 tectonic-like complex member MKS1 [Eriocheir sinensis]